MVGGGKIFTSPKFRNHIIKSPLQSTKMSSYDIGSYVEHLPKFKVIVCRFCEECIPPKDPLSHYQLNHTATKEHPVSTEIRHKIRDYMATLNLCNPKNVVHPNRLVPQLKIIKEGYTCNFEGCGVCRTTSGGMRTHYYAHKKPIPKDFKDWKETSLQTFFEGYHQK